MEFNLAFLVAIICAACLGVDAEIVRRKSIKIHIPLEVRHHKHTHTVTKNIHHYHKPSKSLKDNLKHEHVHHHYRDEDNQLVTFNEQQQQHQFVPSASNKKEKFVFDDNFVNIENEALESLAVLQSEKTEVRTTGKPVRDILIPAASIQSSSSSTKLPTVARSRSHVNSRRRGTTKAPSSTTTTTKTTTQKTTAAATTTSPADAAAE